MENLRAGEALVILLAAIMEGTPIVAAFLLAFKVI